MPNKRKSKDQDEVKATLENIALQIEHAKKSIMPYIEVLKENDWESLETFNESTKAKESEAAIKKLNEIKEQLESIAILKYYDNALINKVKKQLEEIETFTQEAQKANFLKNETIEKLQESIKKQLSKQADTFKKSLDSLNEKIKEAPEKIAAFIRTEEYKKVVSIFPDFNDYIENGNERNLLLLYDFVENISLLLPYIEKEAEKAKEHNNGHPIKFKTFISDIDPLTGNIEESLYKKIFSLAGNKKQKQLNKNDEDLIKVFTKRPTEFITPIDKVTNNAFKGILTSNELIPVAVEKRGSKKQIDTKVSISFNEMQGVKTANLTAYDREVYDAIITLYIDGENKIMTPRMIYQTMTGNDAAILNPKQAEAINNSITKFMYSNVTIDASEEAEAYGYDSFKYNGNLLYAEKITASINNNIMEAIHIIKTPVLYKYASRKNQIGRIKLNLLNSPINKNEEVITLQGYLYRRILTIKGSSKLSPVIVYDSIFKAIDINAATQAALRKKKAKVRDHVKVILDYWKEEGFIKNYKENKKGREVYSITIHS